ncbi:MAG: trehalase family glycosidase [Eubacteriales bacterium]|nr:trehalase family glycosidase [Eubacteriales bacterium]
MSEGLEKGLPLWGPYSKKYMGVSRPVPEEKTAAPGARFDLVVFPTLAFSGVRPPNAVVSSGYHPWDAAGDLGYFSYRYELVEKELVYADVAVASADDNTAVIQVDFHNNSSLKQNCLINLFSAIEYRDKQTVYAEKTTDTILWDALDYVKYEYADPRPWDGLNPDGTKKGEFLDSGFLYGHGLGDRVSREYVINVPEKAFGADAGDRVTYCQKIHDFDDGILMIRYRTPENQNAEFDLYATCRGITKKSEVTFPASDQPAFVRVPVHFLRFGDFTVDMVSKGGGGIELDCFFLTEKRNAGRIFVRERCREVKPISCVKKNQIYEYKYEDIYETYHLKTFGEHVLERSVYSGCLEDAVISRLSSPYTLTSDMQKPQTMAFSRKEERGYYHNVMVHSVFLNPGESHTEYMAVSVEGLTQLSVQDCREIMEAGKRKVSPMRYCSDGKKYELSGRLLRAATLTNIVYPIYCHGSYIRHFTPGKRWDSLYTWDSGFIGLGLLDVNPKFAEYILDLYLSTEDNRDYAFLNHGSPVPMEIILFYEMLQRAENKAVFAGYYERAKMFYEFLAGRMYGSTTAKFKTGLTNTYDYYYNASGMDDLPAQLYVFHHGLQNTVAPVVSVCMLILSGKILKRIAEWLGRQEDKAVYERDIERWSDALQTYSWDEETGYFSYVVHDEAGDFKCRMVTEDGENFNKGMEGCLPFLADACTPQQRQRLLGHITSEKEMFSPVGISAVDMSSGYYTGNGYWNGCVWFPYQWLLWKALLDDGNGELAFKIASTALSSYGREADFSYNTYEFLNIASGRGGWHHQFGGLSTPVNIWGNAYYRQGTVSAGFQTWIQSVSFDEDGRKACISVDQQRKDASVILVNMAPGCEYKAVFSGEVLQTVKRSETTVEVRLPAGIKGELQIFPA